jgi:hypothetical protein
MSSYTPGPWTVERDGSTVTMGGQCVITGPAPDGAPREEEKANARLIAAAPELLEALASLVEYADAYSNQMLKFGYGAEQLGVGADSQSVSGKARAAVAKATGQT